MSQQCHKYFFQYSTFPSKRPQTCFLPWAPSNLCMPLVRNARLLCKTSLITAQLLLFVWPVDHTRKWRGDWAGLVAAPIAGCYANSRSRDRVGRVFHVTYVRQVYHVGLRLRALEKCNRRLVQCWGLVVKVQHMQYVRQLQVQMGGDIRSIVVQSSLDAPSLVQIGCVGDWQWRHLTNDARTFVQPCLWRHSYSSGQLLYFIESSEAVLF